MTFFPTYWKIIAVTCFVAATILLISKVGSIPNILSSLGNISLVELIIVTMLFALLRFSQALCFAVVASTINVRISMGSSMDLMALKGFFNLGLGGAGLVAQAAHSRTTNLLSLPEFTAATLIQSLFLVSSFGIALLFAVFWIEAPQSFVIFCALACVFVFTLPLIAFLILNSITYASALIPSSMSDSASKLRQAVTFNPKRLMLAAWLLQILIVLFRIARIALIGLFLSSEIDIRSLIATTLVADFASLIPLTPGGIGLREFVIGVGANIVDQFDLFMAAAVLDRAVAITCNLLHGGFVLLKILVMTKSSNKKKSAKSCK